MSCGDKPGETWASPGGLIIKGAGATFPQTLCEHYPNTAVAKTLKGALDWGLTRGQPTEIEMGSIPLPDAMVAKAQTVLAQVQQGVRNWALDRLARAP